MEDVTVNTALLFMEDDPDRNVNNGYIKTKKISPANETQCLLKVRKKKSLCCFDSCSIRRILMEGRGISSINQDS